MIDPHSIFLLVSTLIAVVVLILLISVAKLNPFLTLFLISLSLAMVAGMPLATVIHSFETGMGNTLGHIAIVVALGTMLGKMMAESGGADQVAHTLIRLFGEKRVPWAMMVIGLIIGLAGLLRSGLRPSHSHRVHGCAPHGNLAHPRSTSNGRRAFRSPRPRTAASCRVAGRCHL